MTNLNLLPSKKPKSCQGRNGSRSVYGRKAYTVPDMEEFTEESRRKFDKRKPTHGIKVNGKWVQENPYGIQIVDPQRKTTAYMGKYKETHRSEGSDG